MNWSRCIICQKAPRTGVLTNTKKEKGSTDAINLAKFENLYENLHKLWDAGLELTKVLTPKTLTAQMMFDNNALWHRCCRLAYSDTLTERMLEQHKKENPPKPAPETAPEREPDGQAPKRLRTNFQSGLCFFCQRTTNESLFNVTSLTWGQDHLSMAQGLWEDNILYIVNSLHKIDVFF